MSIGASMRRTGFWTLDRLRGGPVRDHYEDVCRRMDGEGASGEQLGRLLDHAVRTTRMYADHRGDDLVSFPVVDRRVFNQRMDDLLSSAYVGKRLASDTTSGSTGTPVTIVRDANKRRRAIADTIAVNELAGLHIGDRLMWIHDWPDGRERPWLARALQNIVEFRLLGMDERDTAEAIQWLESGRIDVVLCSPTKLHELARRLASDGADPSHLSLKAVISDSESLSMAVKARVEAAFGAPVADRYANVENGVLATTTPGENRFRLNRASYIFESLEVHTDEPQAPGEIARLVVTDLYNFALPIIRYDTGDLVRVADAGDDGPLTLQSLDGRRADIIYATDGRELSHGTIKALLDPFDDIERWRFVQHGATDYRLSVVRGGSGVTADAFRTALLPHLGDGARLALDFVDRIEVDPGRKYRAVVREYEPDGQP